MSPARKVLAIFGILFLFFLLSTALFTAKAEEPAPKYPPNCFPVEIVLDVMNKQKMVLLWKGLSAGGVTYGIFVRPDGYWTAVAFAADMSVACIPAEGNKNELVGRNA